MTLDEFIAKIENGHKYKSLYHFTDKENLASIKKNCLLSKEELDKRGIAPSRPGGDAASHNSDRSRGIYGSVSLGLTASHPMAHRCREDGRHPDQIYLAFSPQLLRAPGIRVALGMANSGQTEILPIEDGFDRIDLEILGNHGQPFKDVVARVTATKKIEILIPGSVSMTFCTGSFVPRS